MSAPQLMHFHTLKITKKSDNRSRYINPLHLGHFIVFPPDFSESKTHTYYSKVHAGVN